MPHLAGLPVVHKRAGQPLDQTQPAIGGLEQDRVAVGAGIRDVEADPRRAVEGSGNNTQGVVAESRARRPPSLEEERLSNAFLPRGGLLGGYAS